MRSEPPLTKAERTAMAALMGAFFGSYVYALWSGDWRPLLAQYAFYGAML